MTTTATPTHSYRLPVVQKRAALYIRVSDKSQEDEGTSLISQEQRCRVHCSQHNYTVADSHVFKDVYTGKAYRERPGMSALRAAARNREFDVVVVFAYDRLARKQVHQAVIIDDLEHHGVVIEAVTENFDDSAIGQFMRSTYAFIAEVEREKIVERGERGRRMRVAQGKMVGSGKPLYGYRWNEDHSAYLINPEEAEVVKRIFAMAAAGSTIRGIVVALMADNIPTRMGNHIWRVSTINQLLANPAYTGEAIAYKYTNIKGANQKSNPKPRPVEENVKLPSGVIPALIDQETYAAARRLQARNLLLSPRHNKHEPNELLRCGLISCGVCGSHMYVHRDLTKGRINYVCTKGNQNYGECRRIAISCTKIDSLVWQRVPELIADPAIVAQTVAALRQHNPADDELAPIDRRLRQIAQEIENLIEMGQHAKSRTVLESLGRLLEQLEKEQQELEIEREQVLKIDWQWQTIQERLTAFEERCRLMREKLTDPGSIPAYAEKREAVEFFGIRVLVWPVQHTPRYEIRCDPPTIVSASARDLRMSSPS